MKNIFLLIEQLQTVKQLLINIEKNLDRNFIQSN